MSVYSFDMTHPDINEIMSAINTEIDNYINQLVTEFNVDFSCACDVYYLRQRSRHTPELEAQLINLHKSGNPPNIFEFGF